MKPLNLILLLSLIFFDLVTTGTSQTSPVIPVSRTAERPESEGYSVVRFPTSGNDSAMFFDNYYHPWLEYPYHHEMQGPLPPNSGTDDYEILFNAVGPYPGSTLGRSLCLAGDQNGDGYDDIVTYCHEPPEVRLYFGGDPMDTIPDMVFHLEQDDCTSRVPTELVDLNGDDGIDIVVEWEENWQYQEVYVYYGGAQLDTIMDLTLVCDEGSTSSGEGFGWYMSCGDVNGDGYDDLAIGAPNYHPLIGTAGKIFIYFGGLEFDSIPDFTMTSGYNNFGSVFWGGVSISGDVNNDAFNDIVSRWAKISNDSTGVFLFLGSQNPDSIPDWIYSLPYGSGLYQVYIAQIIKDLNNDNYDEIAVSTMYGYGWQVHLFFGGETLPDEPDLILPGGSEGPRKIKTAGDINADGYNDMIMGSGYDNWAKVYFGGDPMDIYPDITFYLPDAGIDVGFAGDVNNDGIHDFMFYANDDALTDAGQFFIYSDPSLTPYVEPRNNDNNLTVFKLDQNFPNPFNSVTVIPFQSNITGDIKLNIYNILGQCVYFAEYFCTFGENVRVLWDGKDISGNILPSGLYFAEFIAGDYREAIKVEILR